jgi:hypothetical protein
MKRLIKKIYFLLISFFNDDYHKLKNAEILFFCHDVDRNIIIDDKHYSTLLDSLREKFEEKGFKCQSIAHPISYLTGEKSTGKPLSINRKFLIAKFFNKISRNFKIFSKFNKKSLYEKLIEKSKARIIITIGIDGDLCFAARKKNVFIVELFHFIGLTRVPMRYDWKNEPLENLPQGILSLDEVTTKTFSFLTKRGITIKTIPHPFIKNLDNLKNKLFSNVNSDHIKKLENYKRKVLISLSWIYASDCIEYPHLNNVLENELFYKEMADLVNSEKDIFWSFRLHPVQLNMPKYKYMINFMKKFVSQNTNSDFEYISNIPLYNALLINDCHLTMFSSTCYEASVLGIPSLAFCPSILPGGIDENRYFDLENEGYLKKIHFEKEFVKNWVKNVKKKDPRISNLRDDKSYDDSINWILNSGGIYKKD